MQMVGAREFCGDEGYDSANPALHEESDDLPTVLAGNGGLESMTSSCVQIAPCIKQDPQRQSKATTSPKKSPYFAPSRNMRIPSRKRKANAEPLHDTKHEGRSLQRSKSLKRRKHHKGAPDCNKLDRESVNLPRDQPTRIHQVEGILSVDRSGIATDHHGGKKQNLEITGALIGLVERPEEAANIRKAAKKDRRVRERAEHTVRRSSSQETGPKHKPSNPVAEAKALEYAPTESQYSAHEHKQTLNTLGDGIGTSPNIKESQSPAPIAPKALVANETKSTKREVRTEGQKAQRRQEAAQRKADRAKAAEPIEVAEEEVVSRQRKSDEGVSISEGGQDLENATSTPIIPGKGKMKHPRNLSAERPNQPSEYARRVSKSNDTVSLIAAVEEVSAQCRALSEELDRSLSIATAAARLPSPPLIQQSKSRLKHSNSRAPSTRKLRSNTTGLPSPAQSKPSKNGDLGPPDGSTPTKKRSKAIKISPYFTASPTKRSNPISCVPFPPLSSTHFGLVQETLAHSPFRLLIACIFLNKTRGSVALPVFYDLMTRYLTPSALAAARFEDVVAVIQHLGLQNQRANTCINLAKAWLNREPVKGRRWRVLHYPCRGDGKDVKPDEAIEDDDERVAWEVGQLPGVGVYAIDSWRIFCRDELRGLPTGLPDEVTEESKDEELRKEWTRVLPLDKELSAYLRWRWLRNGIVWNPITGEKKPAGEEETETARKGGVIYEGDSMGVIIAEEDRREPNTTMKGEEPSNLASTDIDRHSNSDPATREWFSHPAGAFI